MILMKLRSSKDVKAKVVTHIFLNSHPFPGQVRSGQVRSGQVRSGQGLVALPPIPCMPIWHIPWRVVGDLTGEGVA